MSKHYDNKNDLLRELKRRKDFADNSVSTTFTAYMLITCTVLYSDLGFREGRFRKVLDGFYKRLADFEDGNLTVDDMNKFLKEEAGVYVEFPNLGGKK